MSVRAARHPVSTTGLVAVAMLLAGVAAGPRAEDVTIYRCTDAQGRLSLRDTPCAGGEKQQVQTMVKPADPPPAATPPAPAVVVEPEPSAPPPPAQIVFVQPPQSMYECATPDGETYTSDTPEGDPRWVPLWTLGHPAVTSGHHAGAGTWIRDACHPLPQQEVCDRLRDRRYELGRRYNSAMQGERREIDRKQRGIDARLANDCQGY